MSELLIRVTDAANRVELDRHSDMAVLRDA
jgi:hypothetical protein